MLYLKSSFLLRNPLIIPIYAILHNFTTLESPKINDITIKMIKNTKLHEFHLIVLTAYSNINQTTFIHYIVYEYFYNLHDFNDIDYCNRYKQS